MKLICIGKNKDKALQELEKEYGKRIRSFEKLEIIEVKDEANTHADREKECERIKDLEGKRVLEKLKPSDLVILLDLHGTMDDSLSFSKRLKRLRDEGKSIVFVIAGSLGPSKELAQRADHRWRLSDLTFTHLMTRILILEQIYRAFMIDANRNYHK